MEKAFKSSKQELVKLDVNLKNNYASACKNENFRALIDRLKISDKMAMKYTSKLEKTCACLKNCHNCKSLYTCKNDINGYVYYPEIDGEFLNFSLVPCKYQKEKLLEEKEKQREILSLPEDILNASFKNIDLSDRKRLKVIKWLKEFIDAYGKSSYTKGLFLHGSFGCGKTYLISACLQELKKKNISISIIYFSNLIRKLKENMDSSNFKHIMDEVLSAEILLIDDLGAESLTSWSRDEILGGILQTRMDNKLTTFITSNLNIEELESHLKVTNGKDEPIKARRIIERIKYLTDDMELISASRRV